MKFKLAFLPFLFFACGEASEKEIKKDSTGVQERTAMEDSISVEDEPNQKEIHLSYDKDSLIHACEKFILESYKEKLGDEEFGKDIQVKGSVAFENDDFLILNFNEIIEYGSWVYSSSSIFFNKSRGKLEKVEVTGTKDSKWEVSENLYYEGRINGDLEKQVMLNGNEFPDFIMTCSQSFRTNETIWENIYELDLSRNQIQMFDLSTSSTVIRGDCEGGEYGDQRRFKIKDTKSDLPIIEIVVSESECLEGEVQVEERPSEEYQWDPNRKKFVKIR